MLSSSKPSLDVAAASGEGELSAPAFVGAASERSAALLLSFPQLVFDRIVEGLNPKAIMVCRARPNFDLFFFFFRRANPKTDIPNIAHSSCANTG